MGKDGAWAMHEMRMAGACNPAQDETGCVVFGMPREAINAGAVHEILPLHAMPPHIMAHLTKDAPRLNRV